MLNQHSKELEAKIKMIRAESGKSLFTKRETAHELGGISISSLDRIRKAGSIKSRRVGGKIMFSIEEISRFLVEG